MSVQFLRMINPATALDGQHGLTLTILALIGNIARVERRLIFVEADALRSTASEAVLIMLVYLGGMFLCSRGIG